MPVTIEREPEVEIKPTTGGTYMPPIFGKCPVCGKHLRPHVEGTGEPKAPPVGQGWRSRVKCIGCGAILTYLGGGEWSVWDGKTDMREEGDV